MCLGVFAYSVGKTPSDTGGYSNYLHGVQVEPTGINESTGNTEWWVL